MEPQTELIQVEFALKPRVGQIVGYVLPAGRNPGEVRPAIIVRVWSDTCVQLQVFIDDTNDYVNGKGLMWATSVVYNEEKALGSWHWLTMLGEVEA